MSHIASPELVLCYLTFHELKMPGPETVVAILQELDKLGVTGVTVNSICLTATFSNARWVGLLGDDGSILIPDSLKNLGVEKMFCPGPVELGASFDD